LKGELLKIFIACGRSDITPTMATETVAVDMAVNWQLNPRKQIYFAHGELL
jgi:hypothetical protein